MRTKLSKYDLTLIKSALRRAFARSDVHKAIHEAHAVEHEDPARPRCKKWRWCANCGEVVPAWQCDVDHISPVIPLDKTLTDLAPSELLERSWLCDDSNLQLLCPRCHDAKSAAERKQRPKPQRKKKVK